MITVQLTWTDVSSNEDGYVIEKSFDNLNWQKLVTLPANSVRYTDTIQENLIHYYRIYSFSNSCISEKVYSSICIPSVKDLLDNFVANAVSETQIDLSWTDNSLNRDPYEIEYSLNGEDWVSFPDIHYSERSYSHTGLTRGTKYYYRISVIKTCSDTVLYTDENTFAAIVISNYSALTMTVYDSSKAIVSSFDTLAMSSYDTAITEGPVLPTLYYLIVGNDNSSGSDKTVLKYMSIDMENDVLTEHAEYVQEHRTSTSELVGSDGNYAITSYSSDGLSANDIMLLRYDGSSTLKVETSANDLTTSSPDALFANIALTQGSQENVFISFPVSGTSFIIGSYTSLLIQEENTISTNPTVEHIGSSCIFKDTSTPGDETGYGADILVISQAGASSNFAKGTATYTIDQDNYTATNVASVWRPETTAKIIVAHDRTLDASNKWRYIVKSNTQRYLYFVDLAGNISGGGIMSGDHVSLGLINTEITFKNDYLIITVNGIVYSYSMSGYVTTLIDSFDFATPYYTTGTNDFVTACPFTDFVWITSRTVGACMVEVKPDGTFGRSRDLGTNATSWNGEDGLHVLENPLPTIETVTFDSAVSSLGPTAWYKFQQANFSGNLIDEAGSTYSPYNLTAGHVVAPVAQTPPWRSTVTQYMELLEASNSEYTDTNTPTTTGSLEYDVYGENRTNDTTTIGFRSTQTGPDYAQLIGARIASSQQIFSLFKYPDSVSATILALQVGDSTATSFQINLVPASGDAFDGQPHIVTFKHDGTSVKAKIDNEAWQSTTMGTADYYQASIPVRIGGDTPSGFSPMTADIDAVVIWNSTLTDQQVEDVHDAYINEII